MNASFGMIEWCSVYYYYFYWGEFLAGTRVFGRSWLDLLFAYLQFDARIVRLHCQYTLWQGRTLSLCDTCRHFRRYICGLEESYGSGGILIPFAIYHSS